MEQCLKKGADARKSAISLGSLEYSGDLANQLLNFSSKMEHIYKLLQDLQSRKVEDESQYTKHFAIVDDKLQWYDKAEVGSFEITSPFLRKDDHPKYCFFIISLGGPLLMLNV